MREVLLVGTPPTVGLGCQFHRFETDCFPPSQVQPSFASIPQNSCVNIPSDYCAFLA